MPLDEDIIIRDSTGRFKILRGGKFYDWEAPKQLAVSVHKKLAEEILKKSKIIISENLKSRFLEVIEAYIKDVRDKFETKSTLIREVEAGGMGFTSEQAEIVIEQIEKVKKVAPSPPKEKPLARRPSSIRGEGGMVPLTVSPPAAAPVPAPPIPPGVAEFVFSPADEKEILAHKEKLPAVIAGLKPIEVAKFINEIIRESGLILDEANQKKLENILLIHLKDIRDGYETKATLLYAPGPAGLGLKEEQIEKVLSAARKKISALEEQSKKEEEEKTKKAMEEEKQRIELERKKAEEKVKEKIDARWRELTGREPEPVEIGTELVSPPLALRPKVSQLASPAAPSIVKIAEKAPLPEILPLPPIKPVQKVGEKPEVLPLKVIPKEAPKVMPKAPFAPPFVPKEKPLEILKPKSAPSKVEVTPPVLRRPEIPSKKPRLEDVKVRPRLVGPIEEIRELTLTDFRRLASNPSEATKKILDKLNILEKESFAKRIAGIRAWRDSEVVRLYLEISREVLTKKMTLSQIIAERTHQGAPTLTEEEYRAVMELNKVLRY